jgi:hypothetical protein
MRKLAVVLVCLALAGVAVAQKPSPAKLAAPAAATSVPVSETPSLPVGTAVKMKLETPISTSRNSPGDTFSGRVTEPVLLDGKTVIPVGAALQGRIIKATEPRRIRGTPTIDLRPELIIMPDGQRYTVSAVVVDTDQRSYTDVDDEGRIKGRGHDGGDLRETAIGAGAGAGVGALVAGGHGALVGAAVGATATVVHWLVKRRSVDIPAGSEIIMELSRPMAIGAASSGRDE